MVICVFHPLGLECKGVLSTGTYGLLARDRKGVGLVVGFTALLMKRSLSASLRNAKPITPDKRFPCSIRTNGSSTLCRFVVGLC